MDSIVYIETTSQGVINSYSYMDDEDQKLMENMSNSSAKDSTSNNSNNIEPKEKIIRQLSGVSWMM